MEGGCLWSSSKISLGTDLDISINDHGTNRSVLMKLVPQPKLGGIVNKQRIKTAIQEEMHHCGGWGDRNGMILNS